MNSPQIEWFRRVWIERIPADLAIVEERQFDGGGPLVAVIRNEPWSQGVQRSIVLLLDAMVKRNVARFVGIDGAHAYVRTDPLGAASESVRKTTACHLLERMAISGAEYWHAMHFGRGESVYLCGLEDADMYERAKKLWASMGPLQQDRDTGLFRSPSRKMQKFIDLEFDRGKAMLANLSHRLQENGLCTAAVIATGNLPEILTGSMKSAGFRWVLIRPLSTTQGDLETYIARSTGAPGAMGILATLIAAVDREAGEEPLEWPADGDWGVLHTKQFREMGATEGEPAKRSLRRLLGSRAYRDMSRDQKLAVLDELGPATFLWAEDALPEDVLQELGPDEVQKRRVAALLLSLGPESEEFSVLAKRMPDEHVAFVMALKNIDDARRASLEMARSSGMKERAAATKVLSDPGADHPDIANALGLLTPQEAVEAMVQPECSPDARQAIMRELVLPGLVQGMGEEARRRAGRRPRGFTLVGGVAAMSAALLNWLPIAYLRWAILAILLLGVIDCLRRRNWRAAVAASVVALAYMVGWYWLGQWGVVGGLAAAWLFNAIIVRAPFFAMQDQQFEKMAMELAKARSVDPPEDGQAQ